MRLHVIYIWTHDSFRVGEDGPTHQPVEHEAQIRLMEHLHHHNGERSMLVLRPADGKETATAWGMAMKEQRPVGLILSRQNIKDLPINERFVNRGAYIVSDSENPDVVMIASGSEVSTLIEASSILATEGIKVRIVSVPSEGLFRDQNEEYQQSILPCGVRRYGLTSGLPCTLAGLVGDRGYIHGLDHFGYSAPYKVLDEKFGFTAEAVANDIRKMLKK